MQNTFISVTTLDDVEDGHYFSVALSDVRSLLEVHWGKKIGGTNATGLEIADYGDGQQFYIHLTQGGVALANKIGRFWAKNLLVNKQSVSLLFPDFF